MDGVMAGNGQPLQGALKTIGLHAGGLWRWLTEPVEVIQEPEHRRRARLLAGMLVTIIPAGFWIIVSSL